MSAKDAADKTKEAGESIAKKSKDFAHAVQDLRDKKRLGCYVKAWKIAGTCSLLYKIVLHLKGIASGARRLKLEILQSSLPTEKKGDLMKRIERAETGYQEDLSVVYRIMKDLEVKRESNIRLVNLDATSLQSEERIEAGLLRDTIKHANQQTHGQRLTKLSKEILVKQVNLLESRFGKEVCYVQELYKKAVIEELEQEGFTEAENFVIESEG